MGRRIRIVLLIETSRDYGRMLLDGIADYANLRTVDLLPGERSIDDPVPLGSANGNHDGVIARILDRKQAVQIRHVSVPIVDVFRRSRFCGYPQSGARQQSVVRGDAGPPR